MGVFSDVSLSTDGSTMTVSYNYSEDVEARTFNLTFNGILVASVFGEASVSFTQDEYPQYFTQGLSITFFLVCTEDDESDSENFYYIYVKANDADNKFMEGSDANKSVTIFSNATSYKSIILPKGANSSGVIYHFKAQTITSTSLFIVPYITDIEFPIDFDTVVLTNDTFTAFESSIDLVNQRLEIVNPGVSFSLCSGFGNWLILSNYVYDLSITSVTTPNFTTLPANKTFVYYRWQTNTRTNDNLVLPALPTSSLYYLTIINSTGATETINVIAPPLWTIDTIVPTEGTNATLSFSMNNFGLISLRFFYNPITTTIHILDYYDGSSIVATASPIESTTLLGSLVTALDINTDIKIPVALNTIQYAQVYHIKSLVDQAVSINSQTVSDLEIFLPGTGFVNGIQTTGSQKYAFSIVIFRDGANTRAIPINIFPGVVNPI